MRVLATTALLLLGFAVPAHASGFTVHNGACVLRKVKNDWSVHYNGPMPNAVYFRYDGVAFHQGDLNSPSHGCVRLTWEASAVFYDNLSAGERVQVLP